MYRGRGNKQQPLHRSELTKSGSVKSFCGSKGSAGESFSTILAVLDIISPDAKSQTEYNFYKQITSQLIGSSSVPLVSLVETLQCARFMIFLWRLDWIEQGLTSPPTQYRLSGRQFYRRKDPTNSIKVLKEKLASHRPEEAPNPPGASHCVTSVYDDPCKVDNSFSPHWLLFVSSVMKIAIKKYNINVFISELTNRSELHKRLL